MKRKMSLLCFFLFAYYFETRSHVICGGLKLTIKAGLALKFLILMGAETTCLLP